MKTWSEEADVFGSEVFHRLLVTVGIVLAVVWALRWLESLRRERRVRRRLAGLVATVETTPAGPPRLDVRAAVRRWGPVAGAVCAVWVLVGGGAGVMVGLFVAAGVWWWRRRQAGTVAAEDFDPVEAVRQLPLASDLLAACIAAGAGPVVAAQAVGEALAGPVGDALARGAAEVRLGGEPSEAWLRLAVLPGAGALARLLERADVSGLPAAGPVARLAGEVRAERARAATERARRAAVMVTAPVGLCFLPAFIAIGVLPVVIGLAGGVLGGGGGG